MLCDASIRKMQPRSAISTGVWQIVFTTGAISSGRKHVDSCLDSSYLTDCPANGRSLAWQEKHSSQLSMCKGKLKDIVPDRLGFSLLFYGYGSKKSILDSFGAVACKDGGVLSVNGWAHNLSLRALLLKVVSMLRASGIQSTR